MGNLCGGGTSQRHTGPSPRSPESNAPGRRGVTPREPRRPLEMVMTSSNVSIPKLDLTGVAHAPGDKDAPVPTNISACTATSESSSLPSFPETDVSPVLPLVSSAADAKARTVLTSATPPLTRSVLRRVADIVEHDDVFLRNAAADAASAAQGASTPGSHTAASQEEVARSAWSVALALARSVGCVVPDSLVAPDEPALAAAATPPRVLEQVMPRGRPRYARSTVASRSRSLSSERRPASARAVRRLSPEPRDGSSSVRGWDTGSEPSLGSPLTAGASSVGLSDDDLALLERIAKHNDTPEAKARARRAGGMPLSRSVSMIRESRAILARSQSSSGAQKQGRGRPQQQQQQHLGLSSATSVGTSSTAGASAGEGEGAITLEHERKQVLQRQAEVQAKCQVLKSQAEQLAVVKQTLAANVQQSRQERVRVDQQEQEQLWRLSQQERRLAAQQRDLAREQQDLLRYKRFIEAGQVRRSRQRRRPVPGRSNSYAAGSSSSVSMRTDVSMDHSVSFAGAPSAADRRSIDRTGSSDKRDVSLSSSAGGAAGSAGKDTAAETPKSRTGPRTVVVDLFTESRVIARTSSTPIVPMVSVDLLADPPTRLGGGGGGSGRSGGSGRGSVGTASMPALHTRHSAASAEEPSYVPPTSALLSSISAVAAPAISTAAAAQLTEPIRKRSASTSSLPSSATRAVAAVSPPAPAAAASVATPVVVSAGTSSTSTPRGPGSTTGSDGGRTYLELWRLRSAYETKLHKSESLGSSVMASHVLHHRASTPTLSSDGGGGGGGGGGGCGASGDGAGVGVVGVRTPDHGSPMLMHTPPNGTRSLPALATLAQHVPTTSSPLVSPNEPMRRIPSLDIDNAASADEADDGQGRLAKPVESLAEAPPMVERLAAASATSVPVTRKDGVGNLVAGDDNGSVGDCSIGHSSASIDDDEILAILDQM